MSDVSQLTPEQAAVVKSIVGGMAEVLKVYAEMMENGEHPMTDGPGALRAVAGYLSQVVIEEFV